MRKPRGAVFSVSIGWVPRVPFIFCAVLAGALPHAALAQAAAAAATTASAPAASASATDNALPAVAVTAPGEDGGAANHYRARTSSITGDEDARLRDTPASITVMTAALIADQQAKRLSDVLRNDASVGNAYAPVGYYEGFSIRGFPIDLASAIKVNGMSASGEQQFALENKSRVEVLNGLAGIESGVVAPGGIINFVTKRPENVQSVTVGTDSRGSTSAAVDLGRRFGTDNAFGFRVNAAKEDTHSYVDGANGRRTFGSVALDWNLTPRASLQLDAEFQQLVQKSVSGYQLLGGTVVPSAASASKLLGAQPWAKPTTTDALNLSGRFDYQFNDDWRAYVAISRSRTMIDDNVAFAYGCYYAPSCASGATSPYFFGANGDFDVYDFRSPGEYRRNDEVRSAVTGRVWTGAVRHDVSLGVDIQRRVVSMTTAVNDYVGSENIYGPDLTFDPSQNQAGPSFRQLDAWQYALFATDKVSIGDHWQILGGGREVFLRQRSWAAIDTVATHTDRTTFLPQLAVVYKPVTPLSVYASYSRTLSLGAQAPYRATNAYAFLPPLLSTQVEGGIKYDWRDALSVGLSVFTIDKPFEFADPDAGTGTYTFVQHGTQRNTGVELNVSGRASRDLTLNGSVAAIRARASGTGSLDYEGHQVINVPAMRATVYADYAVHPVPGLHLLGGMVFSGSKTANEEGTARVPAYFVFNAGARYETRIGGHRTTIRLSIDNLFNKYYWQDAGEQQGDAYLFLGAPRTARLSLTYDF
ncbi:TonB-dependent siderophore receptor [Robbsia andropogonis]|uniref:TonB-dependent siderophore receptor n=1 Tax=Robbsia andropogonis TaxID=28092 RepID=UPI0020A17E8F|nr:TonB-dependent siderophore receptor [Robbsia andropogonis]MCP1117864.1 TonB-dependent siderophore receptor [Robbsia andropogonis]MCP1127328.1 TonB-dependent siderophore receptor [Robbsia andropogonis]